MLHVASVRVGEVVRVLRVGRERVPLELLLRGEVERDHVVDPIEPEPRLLLDRRRDPLGRLGVERSRGEAGAGRGWDRSLEVHLPAAHDRHVLALRAFAQRGVRLARVEPQVRDHALRTGLAAQRRDHLREVLCTVERLRRIAGNLLDGAPGTSRLLRLGADRVEQGQGSDQRSDDRHQRQEKPEEGVNGHSTSPRSLALAAWNSASDSTPLSRNSASFFKRSIGSSSSALSNVGGGAPNGCCAPGCGAPGIGGCVGLIVGVGRGTPSGETPGGGIVAGARMGCEGPPPEPLDRPPRLKRDAPNRRIPTSGTTPTRKKIPPKVIPNVLSVCWPGPNEAYSPTTPIVVNR